MTAVPIPVSACEERSGSRVEDLVEAIANDRRLRGSQGHRVVVRRNPPTIAVVGVDDDSLLGEVELLRRQVVSSLHHTRYVTFDDAVEMATTLADRLRSEVEDLTEHVVRPIARGGFIVAGLLSYLGPFEKRQLEGPHDPGAPVLLVDDIALSGVRTGAALRSTDSRTVTIATLCAPAPLMVEVRRREPRVADFIAAVELADRTSERVDIDTETYRHRWGGDDVYWVGATDHVVFAWAEPESEASNPVGGAPSPGWKLAPPSMCLGNAARDDGDAPPVLWDRNRADLGRLAPGWLVATEHDTTFVADDARPGPTIRLDDVSHDMFWAVVETPDRDSALTRLSSRYEVGAETLAADLDTFVGELAAEGVIREAHD